MNVVVVSLGRMGHGQRAAQSDHRDHGYSNRCLFHNAILRSVSEWAPCANAHKSGPR